MRPFNSEDFVMTKNRKCTPILVKMTNSRYFYHFVLKLSFRLPRNVKFSPNFHHTYLHFKNFSYIIFTNEGKKSQEKKSRKNVTDLGWKKKVTGKKSQTQKLFF